ncbi:hypothetical protein, partial [Desulfovibrio sp.]|uniref:hypothetical protein n=1 Tax=Desulfovibrio sp. TaxID=885 RepID=UPI0025C22DAF
KHVAHMILQKIYWMRGTHVRPQTKSAHGRVSEALRTKNANRQIRAGRTLPQEKYETKPLLVNMNQSCYIAAHERA